MKHPAIARRGALALLAASLAAPAWAQGDKPIRLVVPLTTGSTVDTLARAMGPTLAKVTGHAVVVVDHVVARLQVLEEALGVGAPGPGLAVRAAPAGHVALGEHGQLDVGQDEAPFEGLHHDGAARARRHLLHEREELDIGDDPQRHLGVVRPGQARAPGE